MRKKDNIGTPQSGEVLTWFIPPRKIAKVYLDNFLEKKKSERDLKNRMK